jgi:hypothetical protein
MPKPDNGPRPHPPNPDPSTIGGMHPPVPYSDKDTIKPSDYANPSHSHPYREDMTQSPLCGVSNNFRVPTVTLGPNPAAPPDPNLALGSVVQQLLKQSQIGWTVKPVPTGGAQWNPLING